jgi:leucyl-tRNA synthetase
LCNIIFSMGKYDHRKIEKKWQKNWEEQEAHKVVDEVQGKENLYTLVEFPYPSGNLHTGHWYAYAVPDIYVRTRRMQGYNVLYPFGFDAFGLPAENAALKRNINPREWTLGNIDYMREQIKTMGASLDWSREVVTCEPEYYKWTQWLFLQFFKHDLAYLADTQVNWCPSCKTVLANEQVIAGKCERCDHSVEQKEMKQWQLKITDYADRLLDDLDELDWPEEIKQSQRNWIGRSEGATIEFRIMNHESRIKVFTTRPDTLFGATYMVLAPEHQLISDLKPQISNWSEVEKYIKKSLGKTELERLEDAKDKTGVELKGVKAINPATQEEISIWIADYVLMGYGTGAIMAVPAHDERDFEFAKKYELPIRQVIAPETGIHRENEERRDGGCGVIFDPDSQKYAVYKKPTGIFGLYGGGVDSDEDLTKGILREIEEESGLHACQHVEYIAATESHYYNSARKVNRVAKAHCLLLVLENTKTKKLKLEEHENFELTWASADEIIDNWKNHDTESNHDHWFWFLSQAVGRAIELGFDTTSDPASFRHSAYIGEGVLINSGEFNDIDTKDAVKKIIKWLEKKGIGQGSTNYRLRDWIVSRQRYWGCPIPVIFCRRCGENSKSETLNSKEIQNPKPKIQNPVVERDGINYAVIPVPEEDLPVILPEIEDYKPSGDGQSPLAKADTWVQVKCPKCGGDAERETDTLDTFVDSSWYFLRYTDPHNANKFAENSKLKKWLPVDYYSGGAEHTTMHLLYSRFWIKAMHSLGLLDFAEPYTVRKNRSLIMGPDGQKMSKTRGNVVDPDEYVAKLGADTVRMYLAFIGPYNEVNTYPWDLSGIQGVRKFLDRVYNLINHFKTLPKSDVSNVTPDYPLVKVSHQTIKKVTEDIEKLKFNTAIAQLMVFTNELYKKEYEKEVYFLGSSLQVLTILLAPFVPHLAEELWSMLRAEESVFSQPWPEFDEKLAKENEIELVIQINGKVRDKLKVPADISVKEAEKLALNSDKVKSYLVDKKPKKIIYIKGRLVNIVS